MSHSYKSKNPNSFIIFIDIFTCKNYVKKKLQFINCIVCSCYLNDTDFVLIIQIKSHVLKCRIFIHCSVKRQATACKI